MRFAAGLAALFAAAISVSCEAAPLEAYGRLPTIEAAEVAPDGSRLAIIWSDGLARRVAIRDLKDGSTKVLGIGPTKVRMLLWAGPDHLIIVKTTTATITDVIAPRTEWAQAFDYTLSKDRTRPLLADASGSLNVIAGMPVTRKVNGKLQLLVEGVHFVNGHGQDSLFRIDLDTDRSTLVDPGFSDTRDWVIGADGAPVAESEYDQRTGRWTLRIKVMGGWRQVTFVTAPLDQPRLLGLGRSGDTALVAEYQEDAAAYREIDTKVPSWGEPFRKGLFEHPISDPATGRLIGFRTTKGDEEAYEFFDPADAAAWAKITRAYKTSRVGLVSWTDDRSKIVIQVDSPTDGPSYALVDLKARRADPIGFIYDGVGPDDLAPVAPVAFTARDGLALTGYLTTPKAHPSKGLPLVVLPHGGPAARDKPGFDWWSQALASRGYAVLRVNYRGSAGLGLSLLNAGHGEWGRKMQTDLSDGVAQLVRQGVVDPKRVCIVGASYGGYAALAGAALDPGVYRCAASVAGPSDLRRMVAWSKENKGAESQRYWERFMGAKDGRDPVLDAISPAKHAENVSIPVLLVHGKDDTVVPLEQSQIMERAMKAAGKPVEVVIMPSEDHWLSRGETRLLMLKTVVAFLEKNNPPS